MDIEQLRALGFNVRTESTDLVPGDVVTQVMIEYFRAPGHHTDLISPSGSRIPRGVLVEQLRARFGGNRGTLRDPLGQDREIILDPEAPDGTYVSISFKIEPGEPRATRHDH